MSTRYLFLAYILAPFFGNAQTKPAKIPVIPTAGYQQTVGYWTLEEGWHTELHVRNNMADKPLTLTPVAHDAAGHEYSLPALTIPAKTGRSYELHSIFGASAPALLGTFGSLDLRYTAPSLHVLYAAVMIHRMAKPIDFHIDATGIDPSRKAGDREGIWWLPTANSKDFLILTNKADDETAASVKVYNASGASFATPVRLPAHGVVRLSVRSLLEAQGWGTQFGGVEVHTDTNRGYLDTLHYAVDEQVTASAMFKMFGYDERATLATRAWVKDAVWTTRAPMLALTNPDPEMRLPKGATLHPKVYVRNVTANALDANTTFNWRNDQRHGTVTGPTLHLKPYGTQVVDVADLQTQGLIPLEATWASVFLRGGTTPNSLMAVAASFSDEKSYGAQTPFNDQLAFQWAGGMWLVDALHNSITTVGNGGTEAVKTSFTLFYDHPGMNGTPVPYELQETVQPNEHMWVNIGDLIRRGVPDIHGQVLPKTLRTGTYEFKDLSNRVHGSLFEGKVVIDKTNGHASYGCAECCGYNYGMMGDLELPLGAYSDESITSQNSCDAFPDDITGYYSNWRSGNTGIATVDNVGGVSAVAAGSTYITAVAYDVEEDGGGADSLDCPTHNLTSSGGAGVASISCTSVTRGASTTCTGSGPNGVSFSMWQFSDGTNPAVSSQNGSSPTTWAGPAVVSGTVTATANFTDGSTTPVSATLTVNPRAGWAFSAQPSSRVLNIDPSNCQNVPTIPTTPNQTDWDGAACPSVKIGGDNGSFSAGLVNGGPNNGYAFVMSKPEDGGSFTWTISGDIDNPQSAFYKAQCGNYNAQTNTGFISGSTLDADTQRHEGGTVTSHYANYLAAIGTSSGNLGTKLESTIAPPGASISNAVQATVSSVQSFVTNYGGEPCGTHETNRSAACVIDGLINFYPYAACN